MDFFRSKGKDRWGRGGGGMRILSATATYTTCSPLVQSLLCLQMAWKLKHDFVFAGRSSSIMIPHTYNFVIQLFNCRSENLHKAVSQSALVTFRWSFAILLQCIRHLRHLWHHSQKMVSGELQIWYQSLLSFPVFCRTIYNFTYLPLNFVRLSWQGKEYGLFEFFAAKCWPWASGKELNLSYKL